MFKGPQNLAAMSLFCRVVEILWVVSRHGVRALDACVAVVITLML